MSLPNLSVLCGQLLVVGIKGLELSASEQKSLAAGHRGGVVFFKRNVDGGLSTLLSLSRSIAETLTSVTSQPPLVAIDQEGGRVVRLGPPVLALPAMRRVGDLGDDDFAMRLAEAQARELRALGITMSFAPIADIHTRAENPIIGDRSFATTPEKVARFAAAWARGLNRGGVLSCAKHFPGHGDTSVDSHLALPRVERDKVGLEAIEIAAFGPLAKDPAVHSMMSAHVVYPALDPEQPATLSRAVCTDLLRGKLGFQGLLFSDDLEMKAIQLPAGEAAVRAITAGCDSVLVCSKEDMAEEVHAAIIREAESSAAFRARCEEAYSRMTKMRSQISSSVKQAVNESELDAVFSASRAIASDLASRLNLLEKR
jgi:beta-N-acetylhexosaminidase